MARGTTLLRLLDLYRAECRMSLNPAHNAQARDMQVIHLQRVQEWLWSDFNWPILKVDRYLETANGQRLYDMPDDIDIDRVISVSVKHDQAYCTLKPGIDAEHFAAYDSEKDERQWPPQRWRIAESEQLEIWPVPDTDYSAATQEGRIKIRGIRKLAKLVDDNDRAELDDRLIVLFCAAEYLAGQGAKDAQAKQNQAMQHYGKLRGHQTPRKKFRMFGIGADDHIRRVPIAVYNKTS